MNIYVGNLSISVTEEDLRRLFSEFGEIDAVRIIKDQYNGQSRGFGFVEMSPDSKAKEAIEALNGAEVDERKITVNEARERTGQRDRGPGGGNNRRSQGGGYNRSRGNNDRNGRGSHGGSRGGRWNR